MALSTLRFSVGSIACAAVLAAVSLQAGAANAQHQCPKGYYWGRTYTIHKCGQHWCKTYSKWHCIQKQTPPQ